MQAGGRISKERWLAVARGDAPADLVLRGGRVLSVFTREWLDADVAVCDGFVVGLGRYEGARVMDVAGAYVTPGLIDAHVHIESSKLTADQFARAVLPRGTTAIVADPHEIGNVLGSDGIHWLLDTLEGLPIDVFVMAPSCIPASRFESPRQEVSVGAIAGLLRRRRVIGVAEMMNFPGVIAGDPAELAKLETGLTDHVDGHAPAVRGRPLNAYVAAGIASDHEATTFEEALERRRLGMAVMLREASNARNLLDLLPLALTYGPEGLMFCTDDREPDFIESEGHVNQMVRVAVAHGIRPEDALVMASWNAAQFHRLPGLGAIAPGCRADLLVFDDLERFEPRVVLKGGREPEVATVPVPEWVRRTVRPAPVSAASFRLPGSAGARIRAIQVVPGQLLTEALVVDGRVVGGGLEADAARDLAKVAVVERHHATGRVGVGFVTGTGLRRGAFASTVAHDAHNIVVVGMDDASMAACVTRLAEVGGGIVVAEGGRAVDELPLPVAGLMSDRPVEEVAADLRRLEGRLRELGVHLDSPFMALSFLALSVIPRLKITDHGLIDVDRFAVVPVVVS
ncbi:MAG TPA: adenine deaminase [Candidatus Dormibacteraeota bacterium]|nr:adenine deaminase [Candidatus Dormibacteraeota bacterium]